MHSLLVLVNSLLALTRFDAKPTDNEAEPNLTPTKQVATLIPTPRFVQLVLQVGSKAKTLAPTATSQVDRHQGPMRFAPQALLPVDLLTSSWFESSHILTHFARKKAILE